ncbi:MAG: hypothetical protein FWG02_05425 [Holophagaceae bacterium]|nr:hypothetical protein [Holophagaceae bacterium]
MAQSSRAQEKSTASETVTIQGKELYLPHVPSSVDQAKKEYRAINRYLRETLGELEQELSDLYMGVTARDFYGMIVLPKAKAETPEAQFMASILSDESIDLQIKELVDIWNGWQMAIVARGAAKLVDYDESQEPPPATELSEVIKMEAGRVVKRTARAIQAALDGRSVRPPTWDPASLIRMYTLRGNQQQIAIISNELVPNFAQVWDSYTEYFNDRLLAFSDVLESKIVIEDDDINRLYKKTYIVLLEQLRTSLWICRHVWNRMAVKDAVLPRLERLGPYLTRLPDIEEFGELRETDKYAIALTDVINKESARQKGPKLVPIREATPIYTPKEDELLEPVTATVRIGIDMDGSVYEAEYISGPSYLKDICLHAAKLMVYMPLNKTGFKSKQHAVVVYDF